MASNGSEGQPISPIRPMTTLDETPPPTVTNRPVLGEESSTTAAGNILQPLFSQQGTTPVELPSPTQLQMPPFFAPPLQQAQTVHSIAPPSSHIFNLSPSFVTPTSFQTTGGQSSTTLLPPLAQTMMNHSPPVYPTVGAWTGPTIPPNNSLQQPIMINPITSMNPFPLAIPSSYHSSHTPFMDQVQATLRPYSME
ncbi:gibberellin-regulated protein 14-like [Lactuca sativa]|uniref:gibberellin-regulated protein 14-like n=1 Tax=Lactuca sativa TaxID=4236 RepID=UPI000CD838F6|nr:gibberellin-regulated protein 14-like [Lactuca sativa]